VLRSSSAWAVLVPDPSDMVLSLAWISATEGRHRPRPDVGVERGGVRRGRAADDTFGLLLGRERNRALLTRSPKSESYLRAVGTTLVRGLERSCPLDSGRGPDAGRDRSDRDLAADRGCRRIVEAVRRPIPPRAPGWAGAPRLSRRDRSTGCVTMERVRRRRRVRSNTTAGMDAANGRRTATADHARGRWGRDGNERCSAEIEQRWMPSRRMCVATDRAGPRRAAHHCCRHHRDVLLGSVTDDRSRRAVRHRDRRRRGVLLITARRL
jgi:hypothetical protein